MTHAQPRISRALSALGAIAVCALAWSLAVSPVSAQSAPAAPAAADAAKTKGGAAADPFAAHFNVPDSPAAAALGIARGGATPPSFMRRYAFEVIDGDNSTGFAGEFSPYLLAISMRSNPNDRLMSALDYQSSFLTRNLARINASLGYTDGGDKADRAAFALRWTIINTRDPFNDRYLLNAAEYERAGALLRDPNATAEQRAAAAQNSGCLGRMLLGHLARPDPAPETIPEDGPVEPSAADQAEYAACMKRASELNRGSSGTTLELFAVQQWRSEDGGIDNFDEAGTQYSLVLTHGFIDVANIPGRSQLLLALRHGDDVVSEAKNNTLQHRDEDAAALRWRFAPGHEGDLNRLNFSVEAEWSRNEYATQPTQEQWTYTVGSEWRVADNTWLGLNLQQRSGDAVAGDDTVAGVQLRWGFHNEAPNARGEQAAAARRAR